MIIDGTGASGIAFVVDEASERDTLEGSVMRSWPYAIRAMGRQAWLATMRIALREHGTEPWNAKRVREEKPAVMAKLREAGIRVAIVMQTAALPGVRQVHSAWNMLGHPGNPYKWAGTFEVIDGITVVPILNPFNYEYVYSWLIERWLGWAFEVSQGLRQPMMPAPRPLIEPNQAMIDVLLYWAHAMKPLAVDIETNMAGTIITAMGISDGKQSVSAPWHGYAIAGSDGQRSRGLLTYDLGARIAALILSILSTKCIAKILHNGAFDVLQLAKYGINLVHFRYDTLLLHRVAYSQYRHGLQQACATEFPVDPWKTKFKPPKVSAGADAWLGDPHALRRYNAQDAYATHHLWQSLKEKLGA